MSLSALEATLPAVLGPRAPQVKSCKGWDDLTERLLSAEKDYEDQGKDRWHRIWYGLGESSDVAMQWIEIIPDEYGLAVVKTGVAMILTVRGCRPDSVATLGCLTARDQLAWKSLEKRRKIFQAFEEIRKAMNSTNPLKGSFRSHSDVAVALDELQQAIIDSVNDILVLTAKEQHSCELSSLLLLFFLLSAALCVTNHGVLADLPIQGANLRRTSFTRREQNTVTLTWFFNFCPRKPKD